MHWEVRLVGHLQLFAAGFRTVVARQTEAIMILRLPQPEPAQEGLTRPPRISLP